MTGQPKQGEDMEAEVPSPPSPRSRDDNGWTLVERAEALGARPRAASPSPECPAADTPAEQEEPQDGLKSPESERLADDLLREPFQAGAHLQLQLAGPPPAPTVEEPATPTAAAGPHGGSSRDDLALAVHERLQHCHDPVGISQALGEAAAAAAAAAERDSVLTAGTVCGAGAWGFDRHHHERLRAVSRLSGEGALEGFQDPQDLMFADSAAPGAAARIGGSAAADAAVAEYGGGAGAAGGGSVSLSWDALLAGVWGDLARELEDVRSLVAATAAALWERVREGRLAVEDWAAEVRGAAHKAAKSMGRPGCPLWTLLGISGLAAVALAALAAQLLVNRRLASQLRQRDKDLARLVVKILNLQDALQSASRAVPVLRAVPLERFTTTTTLMTMV